MKRFRLLVVAALAASSLGIAAAPASACDPDTRPCCPNDGPVNRLWEKLSGEPLIRCPWA